MIPAAASLAVGVQLVMAGVGHAANNVPKTSPVHEPLRTIESALFALTLLPLGEAVAAATAVMLRHRVGSRRAGCASGVVAALLLGNGMVLGSEQVPGFLAFLLWTLMGGLVLVAPRRTTAGHVATPAAATPGS